MIQCLMMFEVKPITIDQAQDLIRKYKLNYFWNKGYEGTKYEFAYKGDKYEWYGVFEEDVLVAVQVLERIDDNNLFLTSLQKIPGTGHGVFEAVMNYFSNYTAPSYAPWRKSFPKSPSRPLRSV